MKLKKALLGIMATLNVFNIYKREINNEITLTNYKINTGKAKDYFKNKKMGK